MICALAFGSLASIAEAGGVMLGDTTIASVAVNGGADTANPGTTCIQVTSPVSASCTAGYVAIPNNNKQLIGAALLNKTTGGKINLYYDDAVGTQHCPGFVFTSCSVNSIQSK